MTKLTYVIGTRTFEIDAEDDLASLLVTARTEGFIDGFKVATDTVESMRATPGVFSGKELIVSTLKHNLEKMANAVKYAIVWNDINNQIIKSK